MKPDIYLFNPTCELAVANCSVNFMAPAQLRRFENELSMLPWILARPQDIVLADKVPSQKFTALMEKAGFILPAFRVTGSSFSDPDFLSLKKGRLNPWGWSPAANKLFAPLKPGCSPQFQNSPVAVWREIHRDLYSRKTSLAILQSIVKQHISNQWLAFCDLPEICTNHEEIIALQQRWGRVVVKAPWSSSGRGLQVLRPNEYNQTNRQVISGFLKQQGFVVTGPWHEKVLDLSFQFFSHGNGVVEYKGLTSFSTDHSGHYNGNYIRELPLGLTPGLKAFIQQNIPEAQKVLTEALIASDYSSAYSGWIGVDALIWKSAEGKLKLHPCIEINCRFTMGAIALRLRDHLSVRSWGEFHIMHGKEGEFARFCAEMTKKEPLIMDKGLIVSGFLSLTPPSPNVLFGAWMSVKVNERMR